MPREVKKLPPNYETKIHLREYDSRAYRPNQYTINTASLQTSLYRNDWTASLMSLTVYPG